MANQDRDLSRVGAKETNNQNDKGAKNASLGPIKTIGISQRKNRLKGGGINRPLKGGV